MAQTVIDRLYEENRILLEYLQGQGEISFQSYVDNHFRKTLVLSIASYFEDILKQGIIELAQESMGDENPLFYFLRNKAVERQYHTYFNWEGKTANQFFGLFGSTFKDFMNQDSSGVSQSDAIRAFLEIGKTRNQLVHQNFVVFPLEKTAEEIYTLYQAALPFVEEFPNKLRQFIQQEADEL